MFDSQLVRFRCNTDCKNDPENCIGERVRASDLFSLSANEADNNDIEIAAHKSGKVRQNRYTPSNVSAAVAFAAV